MKKIILFLLCIFLSGCSLSVNENSFSDELNRIFLSSKDEIKVRQNNSTPYIDYYLPKDMVEIGSDNDAFVFMFDNSRIVMNVNVVGIVNTNFIENYRIEDDGFLPEGDRIYFNQGEYTDIGKNSIPFVFGVYKYDDDYYLHFLSKTVNIYSITNIEEIAEITRHILLIAKTCAVNEELIVSSYSRKDVISYKKKTVNLFEYIIPKDGMLTGIILDESGNLVNDTTE